MSFTVRTLDAISRTIRGDLRRELPGTDATIWPNTLSVFAKVFAAAIHEVDLRSRWIYRQVFVSTADGEHVARHAYEYGMARKPASRATGLVETAGTPDTVYPAGIAFLSGNLRYVSSGDVRSGEDGAVSFLVHSEARGAAMNRAAGETMRLADPALHPTLDAEATVAAGGIGGGADVESDDSLRARVLDRRRRPPQGGATSDYEQFARAVPGVTKAWAHRFAYGPGTVGVWFLFEGREDGIPEPADVAVVREAIEARRLIRADLQVLAPVPFPVDVHIEGLSRDTESARAAIRASLAAMFAERARPGVAVSAALFSRSWIAEAISIAAGEDFHNLVAPAGDIILNDGRMPVLGDVTYG